MLSSGSYQPFGLRLLDPALDLGELLARPGQVDVEHQRDPVLDREHPPAARAVELVLAVLDEPRAADGAAKDLEERGVHAQPAAASISASVTSTIASTSATAMYSSGVWISDIPFARLTHWSPRSLKTFESAAPPERR